MRTISTLLTLLPVLGAIGAIGALGCTRDAPSPASRTTARTSRGASQTGSQTASQADRARPTAEVLRHALPPSSRAEAAASVLPVMLFGDRALSAASTVTSGAHWVAVSARDGERSLSLHSTDQSVALPDGSMLVVPPATVTVRGTPARIERNEGIVSVSWTEGAIAHTLSVECSAPETDRACTDDGYVLERATQLVPLPHRRR